MIFARQSLPVS